MRCNTRTKKFNQYYFYTITKLSKEVYVVEGYIDNATYRGGHRIQQKTTKKECEAIILSMSGKKDYIFIDRTVNEKGYMTDDFNSYIVYTITKHSTNVYELKGYIENGAVCFIRQKTTKKECEDILRSISGYKDYIYLESM